jgi:ornithine carbamoyltransferase
MTARHVLSLADLGPETLAGLVEHSLAIAAGRGQASRPLAGKVVGIYFRGTSTRTRTAFTVGAIKLGAGTIAYGPHDLQLNTGETLQDTARVLSGYLDALVIRTNAPLEEMRTLAAQGEMSVVNAMSDSEHPTQAVADMTTIKEALGRFEGVHVLYLGEGNNSAAALALAVAMTPGMRLTIVTPEGYGLPREALDAAVPFTRESGSVVEQFHDPASLPRGVDVVYTTRWETMGVSKPDPNWREHFIPYRVTPELMARVSKPSGTVFLHDLPAIRGSEVVDEVLDGPQSIAFRQARHKMTSAMAILSWCLGAEPNA